MFVVALFSKGGMGGGCIKLMAMVGSFLGWQGILVTLFLASILGSIVCLILRLTNVINKKSQTPFGIFQSIGAIITIFAGNTLIAFYSK